MEQPEPKIEWLDVLALVVAAALGLWCVWIVNARMVWIGKAVHLWAAGSFGYFIIVTLGGRAVLAFVLASLPTEGFLLGGKLAGWPGAAAGALAGLLLTPPVASVATVIMEALFYARKPDAADDRDPTEST